MEISSEVIKKISITLTDQEAWILYTALEEQKIMVKRKYYGYTQPAVIRELSRIIIQEIES